MFNKISGKLIEHVYEYDIIILPFGINNSMNHGILNEFDVNFPDIKEQEIKTGYGDIRKYGKHSVFIIDGTVKVFCVYCLNGKKFIDEYFEKFFKDNYNLLKGHNIAVQSDNIKDNEKCLKLFNMPDINITIYEDKEVNYDYEHYVYICRLNKFYKTKKLTREQYITLRNKEEWKFKYGIYKKMPKDWTYIKEKRKKNKILSIKTK